ncbi:MAG: hypothetical protein WAM92_17430 [Mycobacterium sp.]
MKKSALAVAAASGLVAATLGFAAPVVATPSDGESAQDTVNRLESEGFRVILNKVGTAPLDQCTATAVRPGQDVTEPGTSRIGGRDPAQEVRYTTVYVDVQC